MARDEDNSRRCCSKFRVSRRMVRIYISAFAMMFSMAYSITLIFPFLPFMVRFLLPEIEDTDTGKYAGAIGSSLFFGHFVSNYIWGSIADSKGRKPVLVVSAILTGSASVAFGFSNSFALAVFLRFLVGFFNGIVGTLKASLSESSDNTNQAFGMTVLTSAFGTGLVIGPALSGAIADPVGQYNLTITDPVVNSFITTFPYSLPCIVSGALFAVSAVIVIVIMPETLGHNKPETTAAVEHDRPSTNSQTDENTETLVSDHDGPGNGDNMVSTKKSEVNGEIERERLINDYDRDVTVSVSIDSRVHLTDVGLYGDSERTNKKLSNSLVQRTDEQDQVMTEIELDRIGNDSDQDTLLGGDSGKTHTGASRVRSRLMKMAKSLRSGFIKSLKDLKWFMSDRTTRLSVLSYCTFSFVMVAFEEVYPLWCATERYHGGLGFSLGQIGISLGVIGGLLLPFSFFIFPLFEKLIGSINTFQCGAVVIMLFIVLTPSLHYFENVYLLWSFLLIFLMMIRLSGNICFGALYLFINNSVTFDKLGAVNGLAATLTALFRTVSPVFAGTIYSASLTNGLGFPLNYSLIFIIFGISILVVMVMVACLPQTINKQKVVNNDEDIVSRETGEHELVNQRQEQKHSSVTTSHDHDKVIKFIL